MSRLKKILVIFFCAFLILVLYSYFSVKIFASDKNTYQLEEVNPHKIGLILGTSKYLKSGGENLYFKFRIEGAVKLFNSKKINYILVSGDNGSVNYNEPKMIQEDLIKHGIPKSKIILDYAGFSTIESIQRCKFVFQETKILLISQKFQNERAIYIADHFGMKAEAYNCKDVSKYYGLKTNFREIFARTKMLFDLLFNVKPKFLGEKIKIGD